MNAFRPKPSVARDVVRFTVSLLVMILLARTWLAQTFFVPSGSMAPTLLGLHRDVVCPECGFTFAVGSDGSSDQLAICPNCSAIGKPLGDAPLVHGDRVLVAKGAFDFRPPRRWEVIAFRAPAHASDVQVKRVVGLPGEAVEIRGGDIYINGQIERKTWDQQRAVALLVHDERFRPAHETPSRTGWRSEGKTYWKALDGGFYRFPGVINRNPPVAGSDDWLWWQHFDSSPGERGSTVATSVADRYAYNEGRVFRDSNPVRDLFWTCRFHVRGGKQLLLSATDGEFEFRAEFDLNERKVELKRGEQTVAATDSPDLLDGGDHHLGVSLVDQQFLLTIDNQLVLASPFERAASAAKPSSRPFAIGGETLNIAIFDLQVFRDVYYTDPLGLRAAAGVGSQYRLADDEYYALGDNSPDSLDSRFLSAGPAIAGKLLVGKPLAVYFPSRWWSLGGLRFQIPEITRIRYIR